jgi:hypothetical protein
MIGNSSYLQLTFSMDQFKTRSHLNAVLTNFKMQIRIRKWATQKLNYLYFMHAELLYIGLCSLCSP